MNSREKKPTPIIKQQAKGAASEMPLPRPRIISPVYSYSKALIWKVKVDNMINNQEKMPSPKYKILAFIKNINPTVNESHP